MDYWYFFLHLHTGFCNKLAEDSFLKDSFFFKLLATDFYLYKKRKMFASLQQSLFHNSQFVAQPKSVVAFCFVNLCCSIAKKKSLNVRAKKSFYKRKSSVKKNILENSKFLKYFHAKCILVYLRFALYKNNFYFDNNHLLLCCLLHSLYIHSPSLCACHVLSLQLLKFLVPYQMLNCYTNK